MGGFHHLQTHTGWRQVLAGFAAWRHPQPGWLALDVGCSGGLFPALLSAYGCLAFGVDINFQDLAAGRLNPRLACADAYRLPFPSAAFDLLSAANLLFFLDEPVSCLLEMRRVLKTGGLLVMLNPSERMSLKAAARLAAQRELRGLEYQSLLGWARRAETHRRWTEDQLRPLLERAGFNLLAAEYRLGPGLAMFSCSQAI